MNGREQRIGGTMESMEKDGKRLRRKEVSGLIEEKNDGKGRKKRRESKEEDSRQRMREGKREVKKERGYEEKRGRNRRK